MLDDRSLKFPEVTGRVIGCAMKVHSAIGFGFQELIYQRALAYEMLRQGVSFDQECEMPVFYDGVQMGTRRGGFSG